MLPDTLAKFDREVRIKYRVDENPTREAYSQKTQAALSIQWRIGGQTGGSCWDDGDAEYEDLGSDDMPEFKELDKLLAEYAPNIKGLDNLIKTCTYIEDEYYGNYTQWQVKYILIEDLYNFLKQNV